MSEVAKASAGTLEFFREVTKYFMDFLETDFHKATLPKRAIKGRNASGLLVSFNLKKYETFSTLIEKHLIEKFPSETTIQIKKGQHKTKLPKNVLDLIQLQVSKIEESDFKRLLQKIAIRVEQEATLNKDDFDFALMNSIDQTSIDYYTEIIHPFIVSLTKPLTNKELGDEGDIYMMEQELVDTFVEILRTKLSELLRQLMVGEKVDANLEISQTISLRDLQEGLRSHFANMRVADIFDEVKDLDNNKSILDKQDFYLYFGEISFKNNKYPLFYIPINLVRVQESYQLEFDSQVYINKKALEYIAQEFNKERF